MAIVIALYVGLVVVAGFFFTVVRKEIPTGSAGTYLYVFFGPALSLFTHMSYFLFAIQSTLLLPWLLLGALKEQAQKLSLFIFVVCWLGVGWYMHDLF